MAKAPSQRDHVLIFGAAGAIGKQLVTALSKDLPPGSVIAALRRTPLPDTLTKDASGAEVVVCELGVNLRDTASVSAVVLKYADRIGAIWNLAAPLSVETENDPSAAEDTTVGGMRRLIQAMDDAGLPPETKLLFSDSIGSFGGSSPRLDVPASWLVANPTQDPGSEYGRQKRRCRELLAGSRYDTRWVIIPGVLHNDPVWGAGTTEYALDALLHFHRHRTGGDGSGAAQSFACPVRQDTLLPMIHSEDLTRGLVALMAAERSALCEPEQGYALAGFSFSPRDLAACLANSNAASQAGPSGGLSAWDASFAATDGPAGCFAELWPDSISGAEAERDLGWRAVAGLADTVDSILRAHAARDMEVNKAHTSAQSGATQD